MLFGVIWLNFWALILIQFHGLKKKKKFSHSLGWNVIPITVAVAVAIEQASNTIVLQSDYFLLFIINVIIIVLLYSII